MGFIELLMKCNEGMYNMDNKLLNNSTQWLQLISIYHVLVQNDLRDASVAPRDSTLFQKELIILNQWFF